MNYCKVVPGGLSEIGVEIVTAALVARLIVQQRELVDAQVWGLPGFV